MGTLEPAKQGLPGMFSGWEKQSCQRLFHIGPYSFSDLLLRLITL